MRNLVKYVGIGLLVMGLAACDDKDTNASTEGTVAESNAAGQSVNLLDGKLSFQLPADMTDQSGKLGTQANNMHVYSDASGQKAVIVIMVMILTSIWQCWRSVWKINSAAVTHNCRSSRTKPSKLMGTSYSSWTVLSPQKARQLILLLFWAI